MPFIGMISDSLNNRLSVSQITDTIQDDTAPTLRIEYENESDLS